MKGACGDASRRASKWALTSPTWLQKAVFPALQPHLKGLLSQHYARLLVAQ